MKFKLKNQVINSTSSLGLNTKNHINHLLDINSESAIKLGTMGYMARCLVKYATFPHRDPKSHQFIRKNGSYSLIFTDLSENGLPFGSYPRLIMAWITTEVVLNKSPDLVLEKSLSAFMKNLGLSVTGGKKGTINSLNKHILKLFGTGISCIKEEDGNQSGEILTFSENWDLWWSPINLNEKATRQSSVRLSSTFFNEIINNPIPVDLRALRALKRSPMAIDIYTWLTYRMSYLRRPVGIRWDQLQMQFGSGYAFNERGCENFQRSFKKHLCTVKIIYPDAKVEFGRGVLILKPNTF